MNNSIKIRLGNKDDSAAIRQIALDTWPNTYGKIISKEQIAFMLNAFYNQSIIEEQLNDKTQYFFLAEIENHIVGYAHIIPQPQLDCTYKLSKLYLVPSYHGSGIGKQLLAYTEHFLVNQEIHFLILNVNRYNPAVTFYKKSGYHILESVDISLDKYWLNDYVMQKQLLPN
jgi:diamine N-acetyltransferase